MVTSRPERFFTALDPHPIDVGEVNTKDFMEYSNGVEIYKVVL